MFQEYYRNPSENDKFKRKIMVTEINVCQTWIEKEKKNV